MKTLADRYPVKCYAHPSFEDPAYQKRITAPMPDYEAWERATYDHRRHDKIFVKGSMSGMIRTIDYLQSKSKPPLTTQQEQHIFQQLNYLKWRANQETNLNELKTYDDQIGKASNIISASNLAMIVSLINRTELRSNHNISDALFVLIKSINAFDWRRGLKFSTYCYRGIPNAIRKRLREDFFNRSAASPTFNNITFNFDIPEREVPTKNIVLNLERIFSELRECYGENHVKLLKITFGLDEYGRISRERLSEEWQCKKCRINKMLAESLDLAREIIESEID